MILAVAVALIAVSVPLLGGSLGRLRLVRFRGTILVVLALAGQVLLISGLPEALDNWMGGGLQLITYGLAAVFLYLNRAIPGLWLIAAGGFANATVIAANGGVMPASASALAAAGRSAPVGRFSNSTPLAHPHLAWLGDIMAMPKTWPLANVFSVGDVLLVAGAAYFLHRTGGSRLFRRPGPRSPADQSVP